MDNEVYDENTKLEDLSDGELISIAEQMGMEDAITRDCEGGLVNSEEIIAAIKEVELEEHNAIQKSQEENNGIRHVFKCKTLDVKVWK